MWEIQISEVQIIPLKPKDGLVAFASCLLNDQFYLGNIAIHTCLNAPGEYRLVFPSKVITPGRDIPIYHPINKVTYEAIRTPVVQKYLELMEKAQTKEEDHD